MKLETCTTKHTSNNMHHFSGVEYEAEYEAEYRLLLDRVGDRPGLQAIKQLHQQLDDDEDGTIEPFETGDFIKADLKVMIGLNRLFIRLSIVM